MQKENGTDSNLIISYLSLRRVIGVLGITLPFFLAIGAAVFFQESIQTSISSYYYTGMRDVFVGTLWAIGFFLVSYKGPDPIDNILGNLACGFAIGITLFPTQPDSGASENAEWIGGLHFTFAALFFLTLIVFSLFLFTRTNKDIPPTKRKLLRNKVYIGCGIVMALSIILVAIYSFLPNQELLSITKYNPVFWLEASAIVAFGISWLIKGEALLKDNE